MPDANETIRGMNDEAVVKHHRRQLKSQETIQRARSVTVGSCGGGAGEMMIRTDTNVVYHIMQPVEIAEMIHAMAAMIGMTASLTPKRGAEEWRGWEPGDRRPEKLAEPGWSGKAIGTNVGQKDFLLREGHSEEAVATSLADPAAKGTCLPEPQHSPGMPEAGGGPRLNLDLGRGPEPQEQLMPPEPMTAVPAPATT